MAQSVEALGCRFDSNGVMGIFLFTKSFRPHSGPGFGSASNSNEY